MTAGMKVLVVGSGAREHAILRGLARSAQAPQLYCYASSHNPGVRDVCTAAGGSYAVGKISSAEAVVAFATKVGAALAIIGPEAPLETGVADALWSAGIGCVGPKKAHAQLETSKAFTRGLQAKYQLPGSIQIRTFESVDGIKEFIEDELGGEYVVKADGLCGGKGVKVSGDHLASTEEALAYCAELFAAAPGVPVVIEEKLVGQEFSIISFCDGDHLAHFPPVQDHKRAFHGDLGPNTGGMGSYSCADHLLPFLSQADVDEARAINVATAAALKAEFGEGYVGILYGQFMSTAKGQRVIEYNARFGDPEVLNLVSIMESDLLEMCQATVDGTLTQEHAKFAPMATVCKYAVPSGYPTQAVKGCPVDISQVEHPEFCYLGAVTEVVVGEGDEKKKVLHLTGSRTAGVVGVAPTLMAAEAAAEAEVSRIWGAVWHRRDIGTAESIAAKVSHMRSVRGPRIGIVGSTRGTNTLHIYEEIAQGRLQAEVAVVVSNVADAIILERATKAGVPAIHIGSKGRKRAEFDAELNAVLQKHGCDIVLLVGFMRILSPVFCKAWAGRAVNVHPSLLPAHAGLMDLAVHESVLAAGDQRSGCTVHLVEEVVDAGSIVVQPSCAVSADDTAESLKAKVQALEAPALVEAVRVFAAGGYTLATTAGGGGLTYKDAGVDIDEGERLVDLIKPIVKETLRPGCGMIGGFGGEFDLAEAGYTDPIMVSGTDGVGTKLMLAHKVGSAFANNAVGVDCVAMCVNDIVTMNAEPLWFLDYMATGALQAEAAAAVVTGVADGCKQAKCGLIGGETAEMPAMYSAGTYDVAGFTVGAMERGSALPKFDDMQPGDVLIGIASDGVHSNGFSLVRRVVEKSGLRLDGPSPFAPAPHLAPSASGNGTLGEALLVPTRIYVQSCLAAARSGKVKGISHITGGGLPGNVNRVLPKTLKGVISAAKWPRPPVFDWVQGVGGVASWEMARTFNCGLGMVFVVAPEEVAAVTALLTAEGEHVFEIGSLAACAAGEAQVEIDGLDVWESAAAAAVRSINRPAPAPPDVVSIGARSAEQEALILQAHSRGSSVTETSLPPTAKKLYSGKVRDVYECKDGATLALVATDRQSAFDRILAAVPFKGQVLNQVSEWWFRNSAHIVPNHLTAGDSPDPNVVLAQKCTPFAVEFVCRGYITGSTDTSIWTHYKNGSRLYCGHSLPDGMVKNQKLPEPLLTPTTKCEHDLPVSAEEVYGELGLMSKEDWDYVAEKALALFTFGQKTALARGLILVDTKYEFGKTASGEIVLIDEVHTPDSSRYWIADTYDELFSQGKNPQNIDKEFLRLWFRARCDPYKDATLPPAPTDLVCELSRRYIYLYEKITGEEFVFPSSAGSELTVNERITAAMSKAGLV